MNILIIGCSEVGAALAEVLDKRGHDVSVLDRNAESFDALPEGFGGFTTVGVPIDTEALGRAGIRTCDALFAVTDSDDMNIMAAQLAKQSFGIPKIYARIIDIQKGEVFESMGLSVICPTKLTVSAACAALEESEGMSARVNFENHTVQFSAMDLPEQLVGAMPEDIEYESGEALFGVIRGGGLTMYSGQSMTFEEGDRLIFAQKT